MTAVTLSSGCTGVGGRGCECGYHQLRRTYARDWKRREGERQINARRLSAATCPRRFGRFGVCGAVLESDIVNGVLVVSCWACKRLARGICRECPKRVAGAIGKAPRCAEHKAQAACEHQAHYRALHPEQYRRSARRSYQTNPAARVARNEYKKAWRKANPAKVKAQKRRAALRQPARTLEYHVEYYATHRVREINAARKRRNGTAKPRTCLTPTCRIVVTGRKKKCTTCRIVVTGRKKKCTTCRERDQQQALVVLASHATDRRRRAA